MARLKQTPEDFIVEEVPLRAWEEKILPEPPVGEAYAVVLVEKRNVSHFTMSRFLQRAFRLKRESELGMAGIKDKIAVTKQYATVPLRAARFLEAGERVFTRSDGWIRVTLLGYHSERLTIGKLRGNRFTIRLRDLSRREAESLETAGSLSETVELVYPNYFGDQRFGLTAGEHNAWIGYALVRKDWEEALRLLVENEREDPALHEAREILKRGGMIADPLAHLRRMSRRKRLLYLSSLQSLVSNTILHYLTLLLNERGVLSADDAYPLLGDRLREAYAGLQHEALLERLMRDDQQRVFLTRRVEASLTDEHLREKLYTLTTPLPGYDSPLTKAEEWLLHQLGLGKDDFILRQLPDMPAPGGRRSAYNRIHDLQVQFEDAHTVVVRFTLRTGSYATIAIDQLLTL